MSLIPPWARLAAGGVVLAAAFGAGVWVRDAFCRAEVAQMKATASEATSAALRAERARTASAITEANDKARQLAEAEADLLAAQQARTTAERKLFDAFDADPDLSRPGIPDRVLQQIRDHWRAQ
ncbi:hypothetical protein DL1_19625 [Thioclava dalianensis]|uniref:Uncharacterized protein n=1 Tax=Thioclava dalianensis TaxID=1185766 RepID=A0A074T7Z8_9RHOB|nr:hypothetical protein [Thioclava dalianensis]KEP67814.1 hypothetical protein DL1_19625 [Thioclava dalianensis]